MSATGADAHAALEAAWIRRIAAGERRAFEELYDAYHRRLFRYVIRILRDRERAEEVTSETLVEVWKGAATFKGQSRLSTWIFGIAHHKALNAIRRRPVAEIELDHAKAVPDRGDGPEASVAQAALRENVRRALDRLSPEHHAVVELTHYHGFSYAEIAEIVKCPLNTVKTRMFYARKQLRVHLEHMGVTGATG